MARLRRRGLALAAALTAGAVIAACSSGGPSATGRGGGGSGGSAGVRLVITPSTGSRDVAPGQGIRVVADGGRISQVRVSTSGDPVQGTLSHGATVWHSRWSLGVAASYRVSATAVASGGRRVTATSTFRTLMPQQTFQTEIFEGYRQVYGVGMPIQLDFNRPITNRAAVERALQIQSSSRVVGAWYWNGNQQVDFRPRTYWPVGTRVRFTGHLDGVEGSPGVYGFHELTQTFVIGRSLIVVASTATHHMDVYENGHLRYYWPISTGRPGDDTPNGTYLTIEKGNPVDMKGPGYNIEVPWSVRITFSGDYLHDAYWSVGEQGFTNVSHGCVNMPPADAEIYYQMAVPGDPVTIVGSPRGGTWNNGWTEWFLSWHQLVAGSALHMAVVAGPHGSRFVAQGTLAATRATAPLHTAPAHNSLPA